MLSPAEIARYCEDGQLTPNLGRDAAAIEKIEHKMAAQLKADPELDTDCAPKLQISMSFKRFEYEAPCMSRSATVP